MRSPRIYHPAPLPSGSSVQLHDTAANHVARVLRLPPGAPLILFNGQGGEFAAVIEAIDKRRVLVRVGVHHQRDCEPPLDVWLAQGISRGERMDYTVQKAVELGVKRIIPLFTERCGVQLGGERLDKRVQHWQAVVISACEQSGRNHVPEIAAPRTLPAWLAEPATGPALVLDPEADTTLGALPAPNGPVRLLIGPEGGLTDHEIAFAKQAGYTGLRLGPRILRTETAAVAALAALLARWGDFA